MSTTTIVGIVIIILAFGIMASALMALAALIRRKVEYPEMKKMFADLMDVGIDKSCKMMKKMEKIAKEKEEAYKKSYTIDND